MLPVDWHRFLEAFAKHLAGPLSDVQTRKLASSLTTLANEKQRAAKDAGKKGAAKGKAKPSLGGVGGSASTANKGGRGVGADLESCASRFVSIISGREADHSTRRRRRDR